MKRKVHNYTSNLELTSLLIRIKNYRQHPEMDGSYFANQSINKYILWHTRLSEKAYTESEMKQKKQRILADIKSKVIRLSEHVKSDKPSYNRFGVIIMLMVKKILTKPQFSGYSFKDDFYSDSVYKILKYLENFDHTLISERSGQPVNAFAYISQIIHNSIIYVIGVHKKERDVVIQQQKMMFAESDVSAKDKHNTFIVEKFKEPDPEAVSRIVYINSDDSNAAFEEILSKVRNAENVKSLDVYLKNDIEFTADQYDLLQKLKREYPFFELVRDDLEDLEDD